MSHVRPSSSRRAFLKRSALAAGVATAAGTMAANSIAALHVDDPADTEQRAGLSRGDAAILRFLAAAEIIETDLWLQYNELAGVNAAPSGYASALAVLDEDMAQYISDNTDDEISHERFINAYLVSKGASPVNLDEFRTLPSSKASGARQIGRLTNLMQMAVDTSWWIRYRSHRNPDLGDTFPNLIPSLATGQHPGIPRNDAELGMPNVVTPHIQAIANTAAFHFAFVEQGGTSLYPALAQKVSSLEVLRIVVSIGPTETAHFQVWHDKAGHAPPVTDGTLVFPDFESPDLEGELVKNNLIMPEPCDFLDRRFPRCSIVRPDSARNAAMNAVKALTANGLFIGQSKKFFEAIVELANDADRARRDA